MKEKQKGKIELLAPAGGMEQFKAAVEHGADAVYLGGSMFNARIGAGNFTLDEIREAAAYGHLRNVKTYVTMNTLIFDDELKQAVEYAAKLYDAGADALIVQDLGLGRTVKELIPDFELHLSTQATVYNAEGVTAALKLGYSRTVLARELSLEEIRECCKLGEIEVFVHGALCMCYSGQCQMSRYIGGRSGNRGMCAQPCRLPYIYEDLNGNKIDERYPLSPKDLCLVDKLGDLIGAGVSSLKIEGRMKSAEYAGLVTSIYRKYIDEYYRNGGYVVSEQDRNDLLQVFNRGGFTEGYLQKDPERELMSSSMPKNQGVIIGRVVSAKKGSPYVTVELSGSLDMHDIIEIRPAIKTEKSASDYSVDRRDAASARVTYLVRESANKAIIGDIKGEIKSGDEVYRIVSEELKKRFSPAKSPAGENRRAGVKMTFLAKAGRELKLTLSDIWTGISVTVTSSGYTAERARSKATTQEEMWAQLSKTGNTPFYAENIRIIADEELFMPVSRLNELRRNALEELERRKLEFFEREAIEADLSGKAAGYYCRGKAAGLSEESEMLPADSDSSKSRRNNIGEESGYSTCASNIKKNLILPHIIRKGSTGEFEELIETAARDARASGAAVIANNISQLKPLAERGIKAVGGRGLNITNIAAAATYMELGMSDNYLSSAELLDRNEMEGEPLMIIEHEMKTGTLTDRKGAKYRVEFDEAAHKTYITLKNPLR